MKRQPTEEQKKRAEERRAILRDLAGKVAAMTDEEKAAFMAKTVTVTTCEGHPLSIKNTLLLSMQADNVTLVGGFVQWKQAGRQVRKGERALGIWIPTGMKEEATDKENPAGFIFGSVFDISQTDPIEKGKSE